MALKLRRRPQRPVDRVRDSARRSAVTARDSARKSARWAGKRARTAGRNVSKRMPAHRARVERRKRILWAFGGGAIGAGLAALFDPVRGKARRTRLKDQTTAFVRRRRRRMGRLGRKVASDFQGFRERQAFGREEYAPPNDVTLKQKVESEVFGLAEVPKGSIVVNAEEGVIVLRGQVERPEQIEEVERLVRKVDGVRDVENLLHVKGTTPPNKAGARARR